MNPSSHASREARDNAGTSLGTGKQLPLDAKGHLGHVAAGHVRATLWVGNPALEQHPHAVGRILELWALAKAATSGCDPNTCSISVVPDRGIPTMQIRNSSQLHARTSLQ